MAEVTNTDERLELMVERGLTPEQAQHRLKLSDQLHETAAEAMDALDAQANAFGIALQRAPWRVEALADAEDAFEEKMRAAASAVRDAVRELKEEAA